MGDEPTNPATDTPVPPEPPEECWSLWSEQHREFNGPVGTSEIVVDVQRQDREIHNEDWRAVLIGVHPRWRDEAERAKAEVERLRGSQIPSIPVWGVWIDNHPAWHATKGPGCWAVDDYDDIATFETREEAEMAIEGSPGRTSRIIGCVGDDESGRLVLKVSRLSRDLGLAEGEAGAWEERATKAEVEVERLKAQLTQIRRIVINNPADTLDEVKHLEPGVKAEDCFLIDTWNRAASSEAKTACIKQLKAEVKRLTAERDALQNATVVDFGTRGWMNQATGVMYPTKAEAIAAHRRAAGLDGATGDEREGQP